MLSKTPRNLGTMGDAFTTLPSVRGALRSRMQTTAIIMVTKNQTAKMQPTSIKPVRRFATSQASAQVIRHWQKASFCSTLAAGPSTDQRPPPRPPPCQARQPCMLAPAGGLASKSPRGDSKAVKVALPRCAAVAPSSWKAPQLWPARQRPTRSISVLQISRLTPLKKGPCLLWAKRVISDGSDIAPIMPRASQKEVIKKTPRRWSLSCESSAARAS
mmetsp:Transcript_63203/g.135743  ORF Transcript_63203/g.135743 Transcript_63203/m.135743 type:complete len:216 (+) Transcript_63203:2380-3027(+)